MRALWCGGDLGVSRVLSWVGGEECEAGKTPIFSHQTVLTHPEYECVSGFPQFQSPCTTMVFRSAFSSLAQVCFHVVVIVMYTVYTLVYSSAFLKPFVPLWLLWNLFRHFLQQTKKARTCVNCWQTCVHKGLRETNTLSRCFVEGKKKKKDGQRGERNGSALWFDGCFWRKPV